jgi:hypothetical protein
MKIDISVERQHVVERATQRFGQVDVLDTMASSA